MFTTQSNPFNSPEIDFSPDLAGSVVMGEESDEGDLDIAIIASSMQDSDEGAEESNHVILCSIH